MDLAPQARRLIREGWFALAYYAVYMAYMFVHPESELMHWLTLVVVPFLLICAYQRRVTTDWSLRSSLGTMGLRRGNLTSGLVWAVPFGLGLSLVMQLLLSSNQEAFRDVVMSGKFLYLAPIAFVFLLVTVGFTEEFFFRGVLQTRLAALFKSNIAAILVVSVLFGFYTYPTPT